MSNRGARSLPRKKIVEEAFLAEMIRKERNGKIVVNFQTLKNNNHKK